MSQPVNSLRHAARSKRWLGRPDNALTRRPRTWQRALGRWALYAAAVVAGGFAGTHYDVAAFALSSFEHIRSLYAGLL